jgi:hypothetical protein
VCSSTRIYKTCCQTSVSSSTYELHSKFINVNQFLYRTITGPECRPITGPEVSRTLRIPDFQTVGIWRWYGCHPYEPAAFMLQEIFLVLICDGGVVEARAIVRPEGLSTKNSKDIIGKRTLNQLRHRVPLYNLCNFSLMYCAISRLHAYTACCNWIRVEEH